jgi:transposase-like protein
MSSLPPLLSLMHVFSSEDTAINYLLERGIFYRKEICDCGGKVTLTGKTYRCTRKACRKKESLLKNSFFANGRVKVNESMLIGYLWLSGCSHSIICSMTGHSSNTVTDYLRHYRQLAVFSLDDEDDTVGGPGIIVEVDESKFGKRKYHRGHAVEGAWVIGGVEKTDARKFFTEVVEKRDAATIVEVLSRHILPGSIVHTDCWRAYSNIDTALDVAHGTVNHSVGFINKESGVHTNTIEATWRWLKSVVSLRGRVTQFLPDQLIEQVWRRKHVNDVWGAFISALKETSY